MKQITINISILLLILFYSPVFSKPNVKLLNAANRGDDSAMKAAIADGADINYRSKQGHTPLMFSVHKGCGDCVELLIDARANLNLTAPKNNETALMKAITEDKFDIAHMLLKAGADPNITPKGALPAILYAMNAKNRDLIEALVKSEADLNFKTKSGQTLLHQVTKKKDVELMELFLKNGANPNAQTKNGTTPLMLAANSGCEPCVKVLLKADADPEIKNKGKARAIDFARRGNHRDIMVMLDPDQKEAASLDSDKAVIFVTLIDTLKIPDPGVVCRLIEKKLNHKIEGRTNSKGQIKDEVYKGGIYTISCDKFGRKITFNTPLNVKKTDKPLVHKEILQITVKLKPKKSYQIKGINFASGSAKIRPNPNKELDKLAGVMSDNPDMEIMISGHTDSQGGKAYNIDLSRRRAVNVMEYLIKKGIDKKRLSAKGYGPAKPVASNRTANGRAKNRRIMVEVIKE